MWMFHSIIMVREKHTKKGLTVHTGGLKKFDYSKFDLERIRNTNTKSTKEFKISYFRWLEKLPYLRKIRDERIKKEQLQKKKR